MSLINTILGNEIVSVLKGHPIGKALLGSWSRDEISMIIVNALKGVGHSFKLSFGKDQTVTTSVLEKIGTPIAETDEVKGFRQIDKEKVERIFSQVTRNTLTSIDPIQKNAALYCAGDAGSCNAQIFGNYLLMDDSTELGNLRFVQTIGQKVTLVFNEVKVKLVDIRNMEKPMAELFATREVTVGPVEDGIINIEVNLKFRQ